MSPRIEVGTIASSELGVIRVDTDDGQVTLTVTRPRPDNFGTRKIVSPMAPKLARGLAQLLNAAADRAERQ